MATRGRSGVGRVDNLGRSGLASVANPGAGEHRSSDVQGISICVWGAPGSFPTAAPGNRRVGAHV